MSIAIAQAVADELRQLNLSFPVSIVWHGGEPLSTGLKHFEQLIRPFTDLVTDGLVIHEIQTNATLIDDAWPHFFITHGVKVGVSIDGPAWANKNRRDWNGTMSFDRAFEGIECLKRNNIEFSAIAVVTKEMLGYADDLYSFFCLLGCSVLGINIEEKEGVNISRSVAEEHEVTAFWKTLFRSWQAKPKLKIREFERAFKYFDELLQNTEATMENWTINVFPTIAWNGDVVVLSPELAETPSGQYGNFVVGNIMRESLKNIVSQARTNKYVDNFMKGVDKCRSECAYFEFCRGGQASNKFFETGDFSVTQTEYCRNSKIRLLDGILTEIKDDYE
jgi:uncharacterized protein